MINLKALAVRLQPNTYWSVVGTLGILHARIIEGPTRLLPEDSELMEIKLEGVLIEKDQYTYIPQMVGHVEGLYPWNETSQDQFDFIKSLAIPRS